MEKQLYASSWLIISLVKIYSALSFSFRQPFYSIHHPPDSREPPTEYKMFPFSRLKSISLKTFLQNSIKLNSIINNQRQLSWQILKEEP